MVFACVPYWIFVGMSPLLYMGELNVNLKYFGYYQGALASLFGIGSLFCLFIINRYDQRKLLYGSNYLFITGLISVVLITFLNNSDPLFITLSFIPYIIAGIIPNTLLYPLYLNFIPGAKGRASATLRGAHLIFTAVSLQIAGYLYHNSFHNIGILIVGFISVAIITLFLILKNGELIKLLQK
jgi:DHA1 family bicyclomycin/chloramphenicol resistance-like MFS transporter